MLLDPIKPENIQVSLYISKLRQICMKSL
jgi:hypothetical protein